MLIAPWKIHAGQEYRRLGEMVVARERDCKRHDRRLGELSPAMALRPLSRILTFTSRKHLSRS